MTGPVRIQLSRAKGWRKPDGVVVVSRPTKWGNPFSHLVVGLAYPSLDAEQVHTMVVRNFEDLVGVDRPLTLNERDPDGGDRRPVTYDYPRRAEIRAELAGRDLACWCELDRMCHADVLLRVAAGANR